MVERLFCLSAPFLAFVSPPSSAMVDAGDAFFAAFLQQDEVQLAPGSPFFFSSEAVKVVAFPFSSPFTFPFLSTSCSGQLTKIGNKTSIHRKVNESVYTFRKASPSKQGTRLLPFPNASFFSFFLVCKCRLPHRTESFLGNSGRVFSRS